MAGIVSYDTIAEFLGVLLHCKSYVSNTVVRTARLDAKLQTFLCYANKLLKFCRDLPNGHSRSRIAYKALKRRGHIKGHDITFVKRIGLGKPVYDLVVYRSTDRVRKSV